MEKKSTDCLFCVNGEGCADIDIRICDFGGEGVLATDLPAPPDDDFGWAYGL